MTWFARVRSFLRAMVFRSRVEQDMADEMQVHIALRTDDLMRRGLSRADAARQARIDFGGAARYQDECRDSRGLRLFNELRADLLYAARGIRSSPGFATIVVLSLALGIGANTAMFTVTDALLLKSLPVDRPDQLLIFAAWDDSLRQWTYHFTYREFNELQRRMRSFSGLAASWTVDRSNILADGKTDEGHTHIAIVSGNYFPVLGVRPYAGRSFEDGEAAAVISYGYWERRFGSRPDILGRTVVMNGTPVTIAGIAPRSFTGDSVGQPMDLWIPVTLAPRAVSRWPKRLDSNPVRVIARLGPGVTARQAEAEAKVVYRQLAHELGREAAQNSDALALLPEGKGISRPREHYRRPLVALTIIAGLILLIACANTANLLLTRSEARRKEIAVRLALGAGRGRIVRQLLTESLVLALLGGIAGLPLAAWGAAALSRLARSGPWAVELNLSPDGRVLAYTAVVCLLTGVLFGLAPAWLASGVAPGTAAKGPVTGPGRFRPGKLLVVAQISLSLILVTGAGLFVRTLQNLKSQDLGFERERLLLVRTNAAPAGRGPQNAADGIYEEIDRIPGVRSVSMSQFGLLRQALYIEVTVPRRPPGKPADRVVATARIAPRFLETMGIRLLAGREFTPRDMAEHPGVAIVNESMARRFFGTTDVIGRRFTWGDQPTDPSIEVIGVMRDVAHNALRNRNAVMLYFPGGPDWQDVSDATLVVRTSGPSAGIAVQVREKLRALAPLVTVRSMDWMDAAIDQSLAIERMVAWIAGLFGALALVLACLGLYGMMSYVTARRTSEIGIRVSLGATPVQVIRMVLADALMLGLAGVMLGVPAALAGGQLVAGMLFGIGPHDAATVAGASFVLLVVAAVAAWLPARRAAGVDAMRALRCE